MRLFENPFRHANTGLVELSQAPTAGRLKMILLGILLPIVIGYFALGAWISGEATWIGRGASEIVHGSTARALGLAYFGAALFAHFRWFWGLLGYARVHEIGTKLSLLAIIAGLGFGMYWMLIY